jgi:hypothetical protein
LCVGKCEQPRIGVPTGGPSACCHEPPRDGCCLPPRANRVHARLHRSRKAFGFEQRCYTAEGLARHMAEGDAELAIPRHPVCAFCRPKLTLFAEDDMHAHLQVPSPPPPL